MNFRGVSSALSQGVVNEMLSPVSYETALGRPDPDRLFDGFHWGSGHELVLLEIRLPTLVSITAATPATEVCDCSVHHSDARA